MDTIIQKKPEPKHFMSLLVDYLDNISEYARLVIAEKMTLFSGSIISGLFIAFFSGLIIFFLSLGLAIYVGESMGSLATGFFMVAIGYVVLMVFAIILVKPIIERKVAAVIINALDNEEEIQQ